jgi:hypothetical protein
MERKAEHQLLQWKDSRNRKPLLIYGARQVGKTWLMKKLGEKVLQNYFCFKDQPKEATLCQAESQTPESCKDGVSLKVWQCTLSPKITRCFMPSGYERCPKSHRFISLGPGSPEGRIFGSLFRDGICAKIGD